MVTAVPRPAGRGNELRPTPVAKAARATRLPLVEAETVKEGPGRDALAASRPDLLVVVAYGEILPQAVLDLPRVAPVNLHFSMLPALRGASPVQTALLLGLEETGVTTIVMDAGMDTGPVILQRAERIEPTGRQRVARVQARDDRSGGTRGVRRTAGERNRPATAAGRRARDVHHAHRSRRSGPAMDEPRSRSREPHESDGARARCLDHVQGPGPQGPPRRGGPRIGRGRHGRRGDQGGVRRGARGRAVSGRSSSRPPDASA